MRTIAVPIVAALAAVLTVLFVPSGPAGASGPACVAWAELPPRVALGGGQVDVHVQLRGTPACQGVTADSGGTATLNGPGGSTSDVALHWNHLGGTDTAPLIASVNAIGAYRIDHGELQTYDAQYVHIPYRWSPTQTVVKYAGRFRGVTRAHGVISARLQSYATYDWAPHAGVWVGLQRRTTDGWQTVASAHSGASGWVSFAAGAGEYRLASVSTGAVWSATAAVPSAGV